MTSWSPGKVIKSTLWFIKKEGDEDTKDHRNHVGGEDGPDEVGEVVLAHVRLKDQQELVEPAHHVKGCEIGN